MLKDGNMVDSCANTFGIRSIEFIAEKDSSSTGSTDKSTVCATTTTWVRWERRSTRRHCATNSRCSKTWAATRYALPTNMPAPNWCSSATRWDSGMMIEPFDEWDIAKCKNGYHRYFNDWAEKDMVNMIHHYRNHPSVVMGASATKCHRKAAKGYKTARFLQDICHREDPTRPVTCGHGPGEQRALQRFCGTARHPRIQLSREPIRRGLQQSCLSRWCSVPKPVPP